MEDETSGDKSNDDTKPPLPIPPPLIGLVSLDESNSSRVDMEDEDIDMDVNVKG
ncbi:hypothetical protein PAXRUDRAFT_20593 [Paxillus rubicundulus Ve08.2h10]|uniref:Uncharacterized protein n=1 Tax=Paxillus rubicundulus Ve08.2h10 TaxID=930991 RepID=A0A0D0BQ77_9AGAM|nr:hypothetical protein PAXRUDRAFT_20593 [Paxillus rubicundulus Ve08.2h10]